MTALNRAFAFADRPHRAVGVGEDLHLHVMTGRQVALAEDGRVAEGVLRLALRRGDFACQRRQLAYHPHSATTAARGGLDQHRKLILSDRIGVEFIEDRYTGGGHQLLRLDLRSHRSHRIHRRSDPNQAGVLDRGSEIGVLREKSVAGMDRVGSRRPGGGNDGLGVQIVVGVGQAHAGVRLGDVRGGGVRPGVDRDGAQAESPAGGEDPASDFAAIGNQYSSDGHWAHIRKTPKFDVPLIGLFATADRHIPSTVRVSRGSITPSS